MSFTVDTSGLSALIARIQTVVEQIEPTINEAIDEVAQEGVYLLQEAAPYDPAPNNGVIPGEDGHLRDSFLAMAAEGGSAEVVTTEPIKFSYVTQGTNSPILPVVKKALWWPDAPHPLAWVRGQEANPFHLAVADELATQGAVIIEEHLNALLEGL